MSQVIITLSDFTERGLLSAHFHNARYAPILLSAFSRCEDRRKLSALLRNASETLFVVSSATCGHGNDEFATDIQNELLATRVPSLLVVYSSQVGLGTSFAETSIKESPQDRHLVKFLQKTKFGGRVLPTPTVANIKEFDFMVHRADVWFANYGAPS